MCFIAIAVSMLSHLTCAELEVNGPTAVSCGLGNTLVSTKVTDHDSSSRHLVSLFKNQSPEVSGGAHMGCE